MPLFYSREQKQLNHITVHTLTWRNLIMTTTNNNHHKSTNKSELKSINEEQLIIIETEGDLNSEDNEPTPEEDISKPIRKKKRRVWGVRTKATLLAMAIGTVPVFAVGGIENSSGDITEATMFQYTYQMNLNTSFSGDDNLYVRLKSSTIVIFL